MGLHIVAKTDPDDELFDALLKQNAALVRSLSVAKDALAACVQYEESERAADALKRINAALWDACETVPDESDWAAPTGLREHFDALDRATGEGRR